jgi:DNA-binding beta-propeller fold protein YncE
MDDMRGEGMTVLGPSVTGEARLLADPRRIFLDRAGKIYVADSNNNNRIVRMDDLTTRG